MDDKYKVGSGTIGASDFDDINSSNPAAPSSIGGLNEPLAPYTPKNDKPVNNSNISDSYMNPSFEAPSFLSDPNSYNNVPSFLENTDATITSYSSPADPTTPRLRRTSPSVEVKDEKEVENTGDITDINYNYDTNIEQSLFENPQPKETNYVTNEVIPAYIPPVVENFENIYATEPVVTTQNTYSSYDEPKKRGGAFSWLAAVLIVLFCFGITALLFFFMNSSGGLFTGAISGISDETHVASAKEINDDIKKYFEVIKENSELETRLRDDEIFSNNQNTYWENVSNKGLAIRDKINNLKTKIVDNEVIITPSGEEVAFMNFLDSSGEYIDLHTRISEIMNYTEINSNIISNDIKQKHDLLEILVKIDDLRSGINNAKGELTDMLSQTEDLKTEEILEYYFNLLNEFNSRLIVLKNALSFQSPTNVQKNLKALETIYNPEEHNMIETAFYIDYTTQKSVSAVSSQ